MKNVLAPTRIIHFLLLLTLVVLGLTGMWRSSTSGLKSGLSRFTRGSVEPKIVKEKADQGGLDQEDLNPAGTSGEEAGKEKEKKRRDKLVTAHFMVSPPHTPRTTIDRLILLLSFSFVLPHS